MACGVQGAFNVLSLGEDGGLMRGLWNGDRFLGFVQHFFFFFFFFFFFLNSSNCSNLFLENGGVGLTEVHLVVDDLGCVSVLTSAFDVDTLVGVTFVVYVCREGVFQTVNMRKPSETGCLKAGPSYHPYLPSAIPP